MNSIFKPLWSGLHDLGCFAVALHFIFLWFHESPSQRFKWEKSHLCCWHKVQLQSPVFSWKPIKGDFCAGLLLCMHGSQRVCVCWLSLRFECYEADGEKKPPADTSQYIHYTLCSTLKWEEPYDMWRERIAFINSPGCTLFYVLSWWGGRSRVGRCISDALCSTQWSVLAWVISSLPARGPLNDLWPLGRRLTGMLGHRVLLSVTLLFSVHFQRSRDHFSADSLSGPKGLGSSFGTLCIICHQVQFEALRYDAVISQKPFCGADAGYLLSCCFSSLFLIQGSFKDE